MKKELIRNGNSKIGKDTLIFNMQSATDCSSKKKGLCKLCNKCYAMKAERMYPQVLPFRRKQAQYWENTDIADMIKDFDKTLSRMRNKPKYFRFNESGDFTTCYDIQSIEFIASCFPDIQFYIYTHRTDLIKKYYIKRKKAVVSNLCINISNTKVNGFNQFLAVDKYSEKNAKCPGDCRQCNLCKTNKNITIEVLKH